MIHAPGLLADLDVPFMPRFSLYCYGGDGGGDGGGTGDVGDLGGIGPQSDANAAADAAAADADADAGSSFDDSSFDTPSYDPDSFSGISQADASFMDPVGMEGMSGFISTSAPAPGPGPGAHGPGGSLPENETQAAATVMSVLASENPYGATWGTSKPAVAPGPTGSLSESTAQAVATAALDSPQATTAGIGPAAGQFAAMSPVTVEPPSGLGLTASNLTTVDVANAMGRAGELSLGQALGLGAAKAGVLDATGNLNPLSLISPSMSLVSAVANAPAGSLGAPEGSNVSGPGGGSTGADGDAGASGSGPDGDDGWDEPPPTPEEPPPAPPPAVAAPAGPTVTPSPATSAPGSLIRRRRRSRTILTTPQGVAGLGGDGSAVRGTRRTRSLPLKTLLGG